MECNLATIVEAVSDAIPDAPAIVFGDRRTSYAELDDRAGRLASVLAEAGVGEGATVASYLFNCPEYLEGVLATFKIRAVPANVNYRYVEDELVYLLDNSDAEALIFSGSLGLRVANVQSRAPLVKLWIQVDDGAPLVPGAVWYHEIVAATAPLPRQARSSDDLLLLYTGGTTGMPKGVMWRQGDLLGGGLEKAFAAMKLGMPETAADIASIARSLRDSGHASIQIPASPIMHGTSFGAAVGALAVGGTVVILPSRTFDPHELWRAVEQEKVTQIAIVGDPFARPMLEALEAAEATGRPYDLSSLRLVASSGAIWSAPIKKGLLARADCQLADNLASSEALGMANAVSSRQGEARTASFARGKHATVLTEDGREVEPGTGEIGMLAVGHPIPVGYYKDPEKTARTIREFGGRRYVVPGDFATVEADGTISLLGRGSACINTGGEKVFPEEVEEALKEFPGIVDALVVGVPDATWGEAVTAVVSPAPGTSIDQAALRVHVRSRLAGYKCPKSYVIVDVVQRGPNGKADYAWAKTAASKQLGALSPS